jgi:hypothetical protein
VADELAADGQVLPSHVEQKVAERVAGAARRNPGARGAHGNTIDGKLEYCDLRDLQDIVTAKSLWPTFETTFGTKEGLNGRCAQLAELRNAIRHSRLVDDVTRKDGEAALIWFGRILARG